jgi:GPN-loop GTPase
MQQHASTLTGRRRRTIHVANLDPAAEVFLYEPLFDVRDLISVTDVMQELGLGPNGALVYAMEFLAENLSSWFHDELEQLDDDEYLLLDCPGQLELYTHVPVMKTILDSVRLWGHDGRMVSVFCVDAAFLIDLPKFLSGSLLSLSAMIALELPHVNVLTKGDLMSEERLENILSQSATQLWYQQQDEFYGNFERADNGKSNEIISSSSLTSATARRSTSGSNTATAASSLSSSLPNTNNWNRLTNAICQVLDDYSMVSFVPLNIRNEESIEHVLATVDHAIQYGEDLEVRCDEPEDAEEEEEIEANDD